MNKIKAVIGILFLLLFPANVYAMTGELSISCDPSQIRANETTTCTITGTSDEIVSAVEAKISILNNHISVTSFTKNDSWQSGELTTNNSLINVSVENSTITGSFTVGTLTIKAGDDATATESITVSIQNVKYTDGSGNEFTDDISGGSATINIDGQNEQHETPKGLKSLYSNNGILSPAFSSNYTGGKLVLNSNVSTFDIVAIANNDSDTVVCRNVIDESTYEPLECGNIEFVTSGQKSSMFIEVVVGTGDNEVIYALIVEKDVPNEIGKPELATLVVGGKTIALRPSTEANYYEGYEVTLDSNENYTVSWTLTDDENYKVENPKTNPASHSGEYLPIVIVPKDSSSGLDSVTYIIRVVKAGSTPTPTAMPTEKPVQPPGNPKTGGISAAIMAIILICSLGASIFLYQKNMNSYN